MRSILKRFKEPSTFIALGTLGALFGVPQLAALGAPEMAQALATIGSAVAVALGAVLPERGGE